MNAPAWLPAILAALMLVIAAYTLWRIAMSRVLDTPSDLPRDIAIALLALATAGMLVHWMNLLRPGIWAVLLAIVGVWLTSRRALAMAAGCGIAVYMLLAGVAPSTMSGSTAGYYTMAGMPDMYKDTTITYPALGIVLSVVLLGYAVFTLDRLSPARNAGETTSSTAVLAPRVLVLCEVAIVVTMAYAILAKLV